MSKPHIEVAAGIIRKGDRILISQRGGDSHLAGFWEFPGGKRKNEESFEECLIREVLEELNIEVAIERLFAEVTYEYSEKKVTLRFFLCLIQRGEVKALEGQSFVWAELSALSHYSFPPADLTVLEKLQQTWAQS
jgi:8-oxo-dGTP diphosphatase